MTDITTKQEEKDAAQARLNAAVTALEGLTVDQLKKLIEKAGVEIKNQEKKTKKKSGEDKSAAKTGAKVGAEVSAVDGVGEKAEQPQAVMPV